MSKQTDFLELEKCIVSRLWYLSIIVHQTEIEKKCRIHRESKNLMTLIESCADQGLQNSRWIAYKLLSQIEYNDDTKKNLAREEFNTFLNLLDTRLTNNVKEELQRLFEAVGAAQPNNDISTFQLSQESLESLQSNLLENPLLIHWIIDSLLCIWLPTHFAQTDSVLQNVYFDGIKKLLRFQSHDEIAINNQNSMLPRFQMKVDALDKPHLGVLLSILSKINLTESKEDELLPWLFPALLKFCNSDDVELALYSRKNSKFFKAWHDYLDVTYARCKSADSLENALKICSNVFNFYEKTNATLNANEIFKRTLRMQSHWLMDIFDICYVLLINEQYNEVERILGSTFLKDFWLIMLFKLLNDCPTVQVYPISETPLTSTSICTALRYVLQKSAITECTDPTLERLKRTLENHLDVLDWILERKQYPVFANAAISNLTYPNFTIKQVLNLLESHSILAVLKMTTNIHEKNYEDISSLLRDREETKHTFQAYRAMLSALKAILICDFYDLKYREVAEHFDDMEKCLGSLFPLDLRLEVIENIFSMLFLRYEDFIEPDSSSDGGEEEHTKKMKDTSASETGFLCNKYATRETLHRLRRSIAAADAECAEQKKDRLEQIEVTDRVQKSIAFISKALADAIWRLELLTSPSFVEKQGTPDTDTRKSSNFNDSTIFVDDRLNYSSSAKSRTIFYKPSESSSDESELMRSDLDGSSEAGSQGNGTSNSGRRRKRSRIHSNAAETIIKEAKQRERTLNYMLASKESMVLQCLWKSHYDKASQVIEMFDLTNSRLDGEIQFSRAMRGFRKDMRTQWSNLDTVDSPGAASKHSTLENIRRAVQGGFHTSRTTSQVETFLAAQESSVRLLKTDSTTAKEILTLAALDLSLTMSHTNQDSVNLSDVTMKYLQSCKKFTNTRYHDFFETIYKLLYENKRDLSVKQILCDARMPLSIKGAKEKKDYWSRLMEHLENYRQSRDDYHDEFDESIDENVINPSDRIFHDIITLCDNNLYLPRVHAHLKLLRTIVPENSGSVESDSRLLETSLDAYIGDQIFRLNRELEEVEAIANKLRVNLVHSILVNCCPKLSCTNESRHDGCEKWGSMVLNRLASESDFSVNSSIDPSDDNHEPNQFVTEILCELLDALRRATTSSSILRHEDAKQLSNSDDVRAILSKTQRFATLDLSNLSFGNHTLAFFVNLWNLMMLHTLLIIWCKDPPMDDLRHEISLTTIRYVVGDLGSVSLAALRSKLLGHTPWDPQYFSHAEELNEPAWQDLDVPYDPRVIFALINEYRDTPIIRVYAPKTLSEQLNSATFDYLNYYEKLQVKNKVEDNENIFWLPELVQIYSNLVARKIITNNSSAEFISVDEHLSITRNNRKVSYAPLHYSYDIKFFYTDEKLCNFENNKIARNEDDGFSWQRRIVKPSLLQYLEGHCWLLSYLVQRIHEESPTILDSNCDNLGRTAALENLLKSSWANNLKSLYEDNQIVAGLRKISMSNDLWNSMETMLTNSETKKCLEVINALPDSLLTTNVELQRFKDKILAYLATRSQDLTIDEILRYVYQIKDEQILAQLILTTANDFPVNVCQEALRHVLSHVDKEKLPIHCKLRMNEILCRVNVFHKMLPYCNESLLRFVDADNKIWRDVVNCTEKTDPVSIVRCLIDANQHELCLEWLEYQAVSSAIHWLITQDLLIGLLTNEGDDFKHAMKLLQALPWKKSINLCKGIIGKLESINPLRFVVGYLFENTTSAENQKYYRCLLGIDVLEQLDTKERRSYVHLIEQPLLMLEQLLMNCRLDSLQRILGTIRENPTVVHEYTEEFDKTVRFYASKSLDFRVAVQGDVAEKVKTHRTEDRTGPERTGPVFGSESEDSSVSSNKSQSGDFVMPLTIPTKDEWVPNDKARECSCCRLVIFSMFNRRHHCRRCGRVVCAACSPQRMRLPSYPNSVPVRVCNDCKRQTMLQLHAAPSTPSSETFDCWRLTVDETYNKTLREEFSFENAPNISLCLAILNLHSDNEAYSNFLLDRCDEMKCLLRPDSKGRVNPEVDHGLIIKMIRSLLVAAKVKCAELGLNTGLTHCDRFLSQVDLIATLVNSDCSSLIPRTDKDDHLDDHTLRRLRDLLTEKEQWILALDVSTKTGLDTQGVWAAWGTACLKVGYYERAREKFLHCLDKVIREDSDDWVMLSYPGDSSFDRNKRMAEPFPGSPDENRNKKSSASKTQEGLKNRPSKDPPLLTEILQILEKMNTNDSYAQHNAKSKSAGPQEILNALSSLKAISQGQYSTAYSGIGTKNFRYQESLYYLLMYGSFNSILEFFVRHGEYEKCLSYILENDVEPELFMNSVFLRCLRNGCMTNLYEAMRSKDASLLVFKKYLIYTCHSLERKQLLHTLHQLQLFMKDYVRAAMTCIRFYVTDATTYEDLCSRTHLLVEAQKHLESELQLESFGKKRRKSVSSSMSGQNSLTLEMDPAEIDRHMNTISRQMEIAKFLGNREQEGQSVTEFMSKLSYMESEASSSRTVPTLFGNQQEKTHLAVLAILCGRDVEEGFGIAFRIMQDYNLRPQKIYSLVGHMLALERRINSIEQLIKCCRSSGAPNSNAISDRVLAHCVKLLLDRSRADSNPSPKDQIDALIRIINDVELKIESYIESRQLKAAYLLAVKHSRAQDIRKILKEADRLGQLAIKSICTKWLQQTQGS